MGYLTTITIHNDALHAFKKKPAEFANAIFEGINEANRNHKSACVHFEGFGNYINVQPSRHADDEIVYLHKGNCVTRIGPSEDFRNLVARNSKVAKSFLKSARSIIRQASEYIKKAN